MTDERLLEILTQTQHYLDSIISNFSLLRLDVLTSVGFLLATVVMITMSHKILKLVQSNKGFTFGIRGVVTISWLLGVSALWACFLTPYGISFDAALGAMVTWFVLLALFILLVSSPFIITFAFFCILMLPFLRAWKKDQERVRNMAAGVINTDS